MREQDAYAIPEETPVPAVLDSVDVVTFQERDRETKALTGGTYDRWKWTFKVSDGDYYGIKVTALTTPFISNHPDNKVRLWAETLTGKQWGESEGIDTDEIIGLPCILTVRHEEPRPKKDGTGMWYGLRIQDVFPAGAIDLDTPPF